MRNRLLPLALLAFTATAAAQTPTTHPSDGWVALSVSEYRALRDKAFPPPRPIEPAPVAAALSRVEYDLAVDGQSASGQVRLVADVFKDGWVFIPVPVGLRVREARLDGRLAAIVNGPDGAKEGHPAVMLSRQGRSLITLDVDLPVETRAGSEALTLPVSTAAVQKTALAIATAEVALTASGGLIEQRTPVSSPPSTRFLLSGRPGEPLTLTWGRRTATPSAPRPLRLRGRVVQLVGLGEDGAQVTAQVAVDVVDGAADRVSLRLPQGFSIGQVSGPLVADWETRDASTLTVSLLEPVERATTFTVSGEVRTPRDGKLAVPLVRLLNVEREAGGVAVEVLGAGEITEHSARALDLAEASDLGDLVAPRQSPALVAFRYRSLPSDSPRSLDVTVARYTPQSVLLANVEEARYRALLTEDGKALVDARVAVRTSQRSFLGMTLPERAVLWAASVDGRSVRPGRTAEGALLLPILRANRGVDADRSTVRVLYLVVGGAWAPEGSATLDLPSLDVPASRTTLRVHHPARYRLTLAPGAFRDAATLAVSPSLVDDSEPVRHVTPGSAKGRAAEDKVSKEVETLANDYQKISASSGGKSLLPVNVPFPAVGPSLLLVAELTPEGTSPQVRFTFKRQGN